jgi:hypothetical protein
MLASHPGQEMSRSWVSGEFSSQMTKTSSVTSQVQSIDNHQSFFRWRPDLTVDSSPLSLSWTLARQPMRTREGFGGKIRLLRVEGRWISRSNTASFETTNLGPPGWRLSWTPSLEPRLVSSGAPGGSSRSSSTVSWFFQSAHWVDFPMPARWRRPFATAPRETQLMMFCVTEVRDQPG